MKTVKKLLIVLAILAVCVLKLSAEKPNNDNSSQNAKNANSNTNSDEKPSDKPFQKKIMNRLTAEEREKLKAMHEKNPEGFREEISKRIRERRNDLEERALKSAELARKYHETSDETEKAKLKEQIIATLKSEFDEKMKKNRERLERAEKELQEFKKKIEEREKKREQIIQERINDLLKDPEIKW